LVPLVRRGVEKIEADEPGAVAFAASGGCDGAASLGRIVRFCVVGSDAVDLTVDHEIERMKGSFVGRGGAGVLEAGDNGPSLRKGLAH